MRKEKRGKEGEGEEGVRRGDGGKKRGSGEGRTGEGEREESRRGSLVGGAQRWAHPGLAESRGTEAPCPALGTPLQVEPAFSNNTHLGKEGRHKAVASRETESVSGVMGVTHRLPGAWRKR